jgi:hypothetical protein
MRIRPGGPGDIATVLALGDETVKWMNARGNIQQWGTAPWTGNQMREAAIRDQSSPSRSRPENGRECCSRCDWHSNDLMSEPTGEWSPAWRPTPGTRKRPSGPGRCRSPGNRTCEMRALSPLYIYALAGIGALSHTAARIFATSLSNIG